MQFAQGDVGPRGAAAAERHEGGRWRSLQADDHGGDCCVRRTRPDAGDFSASWHAPFVLALCRLHAGRKVPVETAVAVFLT